MEYRIGFISSFVLFWKFLFQIFLTPLALIDRAVSGGDDWLENYPTTEFVAIVTVSIFTMASYSVIANSEIPDSALDVLAYFDRDTPFASATFFGTIVPIVLSLPIALLCLLFTWRGYKRWNAEFAGRVALSVTFLLAMAYACDLLTLRLTHGQMLLYSPDGHHTVIEAPAWVPVAMTMAGRLIWLHALVFFAVSVGRSRKSRPPAPAEPA